MDTNPSLSLESQDTLSLDAHWKQGMAEWGPEQGQKGKEKRATPPNPIQNERTRTWCQDLQSIMIYDSHMLTLSNPFSPSDRVWHLPTVLVQSFSSPTLETKGFGRVYSRREGAWRHITTFAAPAAIFTHTLPHSWLLLRPVQEFLFTAEMLSIRNTLRLPRLSNYDLWTETSIVKHGKRH